MSVLLMMNNYFHDVATALLITSSAVMYFFARSVNRDSNTEVIKYFVGIYPKLTIMARASLAWIGIGGAIRLLNFGDFEWVGAVGANQVPALIFKHIVIFSVVGTGVYYWRKLSLKVKALRAMVSESSPADRNRTVGKVGA